jgi:hypothetical protein
VRQALVACFPQGTATHDEAVVLREVYKHLKRSGVG